MAGNALNTYPLVLKIRCLSNPVMVTLEPLPGFRSRAPLSFSEVGELPALSMPPCTGEEIPVLLVSWARTRTANGVSEVLTYWLPGTVDLSVLLCFFYPSCLLSGDCSSGWSSCLSQSRLHHVGEESILSRPQSVLSPEPHPSG